MVLVSVGEQSVNGALAAEGWEERRIGGQFVLLGAGAKWVRPVPRKRTFVEAVGRCGHRS